MTPARPGPFWRRIFHWPLFCVLALVHITVLPLLLSERDDDVASIAAGLVYLAFAAADWRYNDSPVSRRSRGPA